MESIWQKVYWNNTVLAYIIAAASILAAWAIIRLIKRSLLTQIEKFAAKTATKYDDVLLSVVEKFVIPFLYLFVNYLIIKQLNLHPKFEKIWDGAMAFVTMVYTVRLVNHAMGFLIARHMRRKGESEDRIRHLSGMLLVVKAFVWIIGLLTLANNFGFDVTTLLASLGVGGIAIALASQAILGDLFSYLVIFFDKPFEIGDFVVVDANTMGSIEFIGIKTTRIRSLSGEQLIISNTQMTNSIIHNFKRMETRRVVFKLSVALQTELSKLRKIPGMVADIIKAQPNVQFDRAHLLDYSNFSINFEMVYIFKSADFNGYMDTQQTILYQVHEAFERNKIDFVYPTQKLFVEGLAEEKARTNGETSNGKTAEKEAR